MASQTKKGHHNLSRNFHICVMEITWCLGENFTAALATGIIMKTVCLINTLHITTLSAPACCEGRSITHPINFTTALNIPLC